MNAVSIKTERGGDGWDLTLTPFVAGSRSRLEVVRGVVPFAQALVGA